MKSLDEVKLLGADELSALLRRTPRTIKADATRRPESLPPRFNIPGTRKLLWLESDVIEWLKKVRTSTTHRLR